MFDFIACCMNDQGSDAKLQHIYQDESPWWAKLIPRLWPEPKVSVVVTAPTYSLASVHVDMTRCWC